MHEIIRASSLSIFFVEFSFKPVYLTMVVKIFKYMENYNYWKMYLHVKILTLDIFIHRLPPLPPFSLSPLQPELSFRFHHHPSGDHNLEY